MPRSTSDSDASPAPNHIAQFYRTPAFLCASVAEFVRRGLAQGEGVVIVATPETWNNTRQELQAMDVATDVLCETGQIKVLDALQLLGELSAKHGPFSRVAIESLVGEAFSKMRKRFPILRCCSELGGAFISHHRLNDVQSLETAWNEFLHAQESTTLLCLYAVSDTTGADATIETRICDHHHETIAAEPASQSQLLLRLAALEQHSLDQRLTQTLKPCPEGELSRLRKSMISHGKLAILGEISAGISHELNNSLTIIQLINDHLIEVEAQTPSASHSAKVLPRLFKIQAATKRMSKIIRSVLSLSRPPSDAVGPVDVTATLHQAVDLLSEVLVTDQIQILWQGESEDLRCLGDADQLIQVFINMLRNARDAIRLTRSKTGGGQIHISVEKIDDHIHIRIADNGKGIEPYLLPQIFSPFFTTKAPDRGSGLGLSISEAIIKDHKGQIQVSSTLNQGSQFTIVLPCGAQSWVPGDRCM